MMTWDEYCGLCGTMRVARMLGLNNSKCAVIAHYRMASLLGAVLADLQRKYPEKVKK